MNKFILEICANSVESAFLAELGGAHRVEFCENILEGGTTPSYGAISLARKMLRIDFNILIRPRGGDFLYSESEFEIMCEDVVMAKQLGADGVVVGFLLSDGSVDKKRTKKLVKLAKPMSVTFHRAFDVCKDPYLALEDIIGCGCNRILTSGRTNKAENGTEIIKKLIEIANDRIIIMPGSGIDESNIEEIYKKTGANEFHASLRTSFESGMIYRNTEVSMGTNDKNDYKRILTDPDRVKKVIEILSRIK